MKLSTFTDYNLRVLLYLAAHQDRLSTIQEIALAYNISENHLMKVIHHLRKMISFYPFVVRVVVFVYIERRAN